MRGLVVLRIPVFAIPPPEGVALSEVGFVPGTGWAITPVPSIKMTDNVKNTFFLIFRSIFCGLFFLWFDGLKKQNSTHRLSLSASVKRLQK